MTLCHRHRRKLWACSFKELSWKGATDMHVHPAIAALRGTPASQRRPGIGEADQTQLARPKSVRDAWLAEPLVQAVLRGLRSYGAGAPLRECQALSEALFLHNAAATLVDGLFHNLLSVLRDYPLGEAPFRSKVSEGLATVQILESAGAVLSLAAYEPLEGAQAPDTALFSDREVHEIVLSGKASCARHTWIGEGHLESKALNLSAGDTIALQSQRQARQILNVQTSLLLLQLTREPTRPAPTRQVSLETGTTLRTASGDKSASQSVMALGVLGAIGDYSALPAMEDTALNMSEDPEVRWEAARQRLGLGPKRGLILLGTLARRKDDALCAPAGALMAQVLTAQPELRALIQEEAA